MNSVRKSQGFTLVEIAIVLVIIGLLLGGILKGQEMITQAKIKNVIADFSGISAAYHGYVDRYKKIPGDEAAPSPSVTAAPPPGAGPAPPRGTATASSPAPTTAPPIPTSRACGGITCAVPALSPAWAISSPSTP